uniref:Uncharacterized protein n=1 Tax=Anguilla anguilla TaxID=7936 RepID=A0A0E9TK66_ANGAN
MCCLTLIIVHLSNTAPVINFFRTYNTQDLTECTDIFINSNNSNYEGYREIATGRTDRLAGHCSAWSGV